MARTLDWRARRLVARIQKNHRDRAAVEALAAHYGKRGDHASLANLMAGYAETLDDSSAAADAYARAADAALMVEDRARAEALYTRALERDPGHGGALDRALRVAEAASDVAGMSRLLSYAIEIGRSRALPGHQLAPLQFRLGQIYETRGRDPERAVEWYRQALESHPGFAGAIAAARNLYRRAGDWATVSRLYEAEIEVCTGLEEQRELLVRLAEHERDERGDLSAAVAALRRARKLDPNFTPALRSLAEALIARSERATGRAREADAKRAAELLYDLARIVPRADATPLLERALALAPQHARAIALLRELRGHAADGGKNRRDMHADQPQRYVDQRSTVQIASAPGSARSARAQALDTEPLSEIGVGAEGALTDRTPALDSAQLRPVRVVPEPAPSDRTQALDTDQLRAARVQTEPIPLVPGRDADRIPAGELDNHDGNESRSPSPASRGTSPHF